MEVNYGKILKYVCSAACFFVFIVIGTMLVGRLMHSDNDLETGEDTYINEYGIVDVEEFVKNLPEKKEIFLSEDIFIQIQSKIYQRCITCPRII